MLIACRSFNCICDHWSVASHHDCLHNCRSMTSVCQCHPTGGSNSAHWQWCVTYSLWSGDSVLCGCVRECPCVSRRVGRSVLHASWLDDQVFFTLVICVLSMLPPHHSWGSVYESADAACVFRIVFFFSEKGIQRVVWKLGCVWCWKWHQAAACVSLSGVFVCVALILQTLL